MKNELSNLVMLWYIEINEIERGILKNAYKMDTQR